MAFIKRFASGKDIHTQKAQVVDRSLGQVSELHRSFGPISRSNHCVDARHCLSFAGIHRLYHRMSMRAAKYLSVKHARHIVICPVSGAPSNFVSTVMTDWRRTYRIEFFVGEDHVWLIFEHSLAPDSRHINSYFS